MKRYDMTPSDPNDPYPDDGLREDECDHLDYEANILTGVATCSCGHRWTQTAQEIAREREAAEAYDKMCAEWDREHGKQDLQEMLPGHSADELPF